MINLVELGRVFIVCGKTDMRRGIDSLAYIVKKSFNLDPFSGMRLSLLRQPEGSLQGTLLGRPGILAAL